MIDMNRIEELRADLSAEDFAEVFACFISEARETLAQLAPLRDQALREALHFLKGGALNIGFTDFALLCQRGLDDSLGGRDPDIPALTRCYFRTEPSLKALAA